MRPAALIALPALGLVLGACAQQKGPPVLGPRSIDTFHVGVRASLRGLDAGDDRHVWASGSAGTVLHSADRGATWRRIPVASASEIDFRDVQALAGDDALLMTAGTPARIQRTDDGGRTWTIVHGDSHPDAFFDALAFFDDDRGVLFGDPVDGVFTLARTDDGGRTWSRVDAGALPVPRPREAGFAASGTNACARADGVVLIGLGGAGPTARVLRSDDFGRTFEAIETPMPASETSGIFSIAHVGGTRWIAVGGDFADPTRNPETAIRAIISDDDGRTWRPAQRSPEAYCSCVASPGHSDSLVIACGSEGVYISGDGGETFTTLDLPGFHACAWSEAERSSTLILVGSGGRIARIVFGQR